MEGVIVELGGDYAFVGRQKRIAIDREDYYVDLLFYHRGMRRLVAAELKLDKFRVAEYLTCLHERRLLEDKLRQAVAAARARLGSGSH